MTDDNVVFISALQHILFCERQFALIHLEQIWEENRFTAEGKILHKRVDVSRHESRKSFRHEFGMTVRSEKLNLVGKCDLVELRFGTKGIVEEVVPVEFKRGEKKEGDEDRIQLCAQAMCLEEMFGIIVSRGEFYYLQEHRRSECSIDVDLRNKVMLLLQQMNALETSRTTPPACYERRKCDNCSLVEMCMPKSAGAGSRRVDRFMQAQLKASRTEDE